MAEGEKSLGAVRFGPFELSLDTQELRKHGVPVKLSGQAIRVLEMLTANPGQLVTREELQKKLWPADSFGDFEHGLNAAVNKLREKLGDSATTPTYVETLPGRGYRFIAQVESGPGGSSPEEGTDLNIVNPPELQPSPNQDEKGQAIIGDASGHMLLWTRSPGWARLGIVAGLLCAAAAISYFAWKLTHEEKQELRAVPLNALPGNAFASSFSPDGQQIVFCWDRGKPGWVEPGAEVFVQIVGESEPVQLTHNSGPPSFRFPAWSPDGKRMAFRKWANGEVEIVTMPALGGHEVVLGKTCCGPRPGEAMSYSPDGKDLAFEDFVPSTEQPAIYLLHLEDLKRTQVTSPPQGIDGDDQPRFSPDGKQLAFVRTLSVGVNQLSTVKLATGEVRSVLTEFSTIWGVAWDE